MMMFLLIAVSSKVGLEQQSIRGMQQSIRGMVKASSAAVVTSEARVDSGYISVAVMVRGGSGGGLRSASTAGAMEVDVFIRCCCG